MVLGWRKAFCTSIRKEKDRDSTSTSTPKQEKSNPTTPKLSKFGFFSSSSSTPSTPRLQSQPVSSSPGLRCRTSVNTPPETPPAPTDLSPKLHCKTSTNSPRFSLRSNASSPRSPSTFSLLKSINAFSLSKHTRCGICLHSVKRGQGTAIFTAECSHTFHFPCVADHVRKQGLLTCPVCSAQWTDLPPPSIHNLGKGQEEERKRGLSSSQSSPRTPVSDKQSSGNGTPRCVLKVYNDDEPLMSPKSGGLFNPIPESDEIDEDNEDVVGEFQGFFPERNNSPFERSPIVAGNVEMEIMPDAAVVSVGRGGQTSVIVLKVKAPPAPIKMRRRAPIDLVAVIDVGGKITKEKLQLMKRLLRFLVSSMTAADRLSIVAFSSTSKRLLPLKRMTAAGRRTARRIVEAIIPLDGTAALSAKDALKKAAKVVEDRRDKNPATGILLLTNSKSNDNRSESHRVHTTRLPNLEIPVHTISLNKTGDYDHAPPSEEHLGKCLESLLCLAAQDLRLQLGIVSGSAAGEISGVYSSSGGSVSLGSGLVRVGDLYAEEERELMVELTVPSMASSGAHRLLSVRSSFIDPSTQKLIQGKEQALLVPRPVAVRSSNPRIERLRGLFITTRALAESRRLVERNELAGAGHVLSTARAFLLQSRAGSGNEFLRSLEVEQSELQNRRQKNQVAQRGRGNQNSHVEEKANEPLTPTSAWRAAERLAKVAMTRKSQNRVSDLHGFENARF